MDIARQADMMTPDEIAERLVRWNYEQVIHVKGDLFHCFTKRNDELYVRAYVEDNKIVAHVYQWAVTDEISL